MVDAKDYAIAALAADMERGLWLAANSFDAAGSARARFAQRVRTTPFGNTPIGATISDSLTGTGPGPHPRPALWNVRDGHWSAHDLPQPPAGTNDHIITALWAVTPRDIWVGTTAALLRFDSGKLRNSWTTIAEGTVADMARDSKGRLWWAGPEGVRFYSDDSGIHNFTENPASALTIARDGTIWIGHEKTVRRYAKGVITRFTLPAAAPLTALWALEEGAVVAGHNRLTGSFGTGAAIEVAGGGLSLNRIRDVAADPLGPIWCTVTPATRLFRISTDFSGRAPLIEPSLRPLKDTDATIPPIRMGGAWFEVVGPWQDYNSRFDPETQRWFTTPQAAMPDLFQNGTPADAFAVSANGGLWTASAEE